MKRKPVDAAAAQASAIDYLLREFKYRGKTSGGVTAGEEPYVFEGPIENGYLIASSTARPEIRAVASFVCDGVDDDEEIGSAVALIKANGGPGEIILTDGEFNFGGVINGGAMDITIRGYGKDTTIINASSGFGSSATALFEFTSGYHNFYDFQVQHGNDASAPVNRTFSLNGINRFINCHIESWEDDWTAPSAFTIFVSGYLYMRDCYVANWDWTYETNHETVHCLSGTVDIENNEIICNAEQDDDYAIYTANLNKSGGIRSNNIDTYARGIFVGWGNGGEIVDNYVRSYAEASAELQGIAAIKLTAGFGYVSGNYVYGGDYGIFSDADNYIITGNRLYNQNRAHIYLNRATQVQVLGNHMVQGGCPAGIHVRADAWNSDGYIQIADNMLNGTYTDGGVYIEVPVGTTNALYNLTVNDNQFVGGVGSVGIHVEGPVIEAMLNDNYFDDITEPFKFTYEDGANFIGFSIVANRITGETYSSQDRWSLCTFDHLNGLLLADNVFRKCFVGLVDSPHASIKGNQFIETPALPSGWKAPLRLESCDQAHVSGNTHSGEDLAVGDGCIEITGTSDGVFIHGEMYQGPGPDDAETTYRDYGIVIGSAVTNLTERDNDWRLCDVAGLLDLGTGTISDTILVVPVYASDPASPVEGELIINSTYNAFKIFMGGVWVTISAGEQVQGVLADPVGVTDLVAVSIDNWRVVPVEPVAVTDSVATGKVIIAAAITDTVGVTDTVSAVKTVIVTSTEPIGVIDDATDVLT